MDSGAFWGGGGRIFPEWILRLALCLGMLAREQRPPAPGAGLAWQPPWQRASPWHRVAWQVQRHGGMAARHYGGTGPALPGAGTARWGAAAPLPWRQGILHSNSRRPATFGGISILHPALSAIWGRRIVAFVYLFSFIFVFFSPSPVTK